MTMLNAHELPCSSRPIAFFAVVLLALASTALPATRVLAKTPEQKCSAGKQKAAGTFVKKLFACSAKATAKGIADPSCQSKAEAKLRLALAKLEQKGGCVTLEDADFMVEYLTFVVGNLAANLPAASEDCSNGLDDNGNGLVDCDDALCTSGPVCIELDCSDNVDSDGDGKADCTDEDCLNDLACIETLCGDGADNDSDQKTDCLDEDCFNTPVCNLCGDGIVQGLESCDGDSLGGGTCESLGFESGTLTCFPFCAWDTTLCVLGSDPLCSP